MGTNRLCFEEFGISPSLGENMECPTPGNLFEILPDLKDNYN